MADSPATICNNDVSTPENIHERLAFLKTLKDGYRALQQRADAAKEIHDRYEANLIEEMAAMDPPMDMAKYGGIRYDRKSTIYGTINDRDAFIAWTEEQDLTDEFIRRMEAKGRVNELVRRCLDNAEELPPGVSFYAKNYIAITA